VRAAARLRFGHVDDRAHVGKLIIETYFSGNTTHIRSAPLCCRACTREVHGRVGEIDRAGGGWSRRQWEKTQPLVEESVVVLFPASAHTMRLPGCGRVARWARLVERLHEKTL